MQIIQSLQMPVKLPLGMRRHQALGELRKVTPFGGQAAANGLVHLFARLRQPFETGKNALGQYFRRGAWSGRAKIRNKIAYSEIDFVPDGGDNWNGGVENCAGYRFLVEGP